MFGYDWPRLHAALNDLPPALLLVAVLFELASVLLNRPTFRVVGFWTLITGAVGGVLAVLSGLQAEEHIAHGEAVHRIMETHEKLAFITLGIFAVVAVWRIVRESRMGGTERGVVLALSLGGLAVLLVTAAYGGKLVFEHAAGVPTPVLEAEMHERAEGHHHHGGEAEEDEQEAPAAADSASGGTTDSAHAAEPSGAHTHPPGTPPHKD
jgi:uncharacterized membrane protein